MAPPSQELEPPANPERFSRGDLGAALSERREAQGAEKSPAEAGLSRSNEELSLQWRWQVRLLAAAVWIVVLRIRGGGLTARVSLATPHILVGRRLLHCVAALAGRRRLASTLVALLSGSSILVGRRLLHCVAALAGRRRLAPTLVALLLSGSSILVGRRLLRCVAALAGRRGLGPTLVALLVRHF
jgi:hypothetical protein